MGAPAYDNFLGIPPQFSSHQNSKAVILPIPFDGTCSWLRGTALGPQAAIDASGQVEFYDIETSSEIYKEIGIHTLPPVQASNVEQMNQAVYKAVKSELADGKFVISIGGEHSVSFGAIKAHAEKYKGLSVLQLDAHTDMRESYDGTKFSHACVMRRTSADLGCPVTAVGIRAIDSSELPNFKMDNVFLADRIHGTTTWINDVIARLSGPVYITLDVDVFEIGLMPSTGTPEPGGLGWYDVMKLLRKVTTACNVVGFDVVELMPKAENRAPDFLVAKLIYKFLGYKFCLNNR